MHAAVLRCLQETDGDLVIVSHKSAIAALTGQRPKLLHTSVSTLAWDGETLTPLEVGRLPHPPLTEAVCLALLRAAGTPEPVVAHCRAVAEKAARLADRAEALGAVPDRSLLLPAALLHDVARTEPHHASVGAAWLRTLGYPEVAELIAVHHDWDAEDCSEAALLYLADKYIQDTREVTLDERFALSRSRCASPEALKAHDRRCIAAKRIENMLNRS